MFTLKVEVESGRGLYATEMILPGTIVMDCEILVLSAIDTPVVNSTELQYYTFKFNETQDCLVLGLGEIFNHADQSNVSYELIKIDGRSVMRFTSTNYIHDGAQLFINYTADTNVDAVKYLQNASLVG